MCYSILLDYRHVGYAHINRQKTNNYRNLQSAQHAEAR